MAGSERDEMGEAFQRHDRAVRDETNDRLLQGCDLGHESALRPVRRKGDGWQVMRPRHTAKVAGIVPA